jgi:hypothetical protein
MLGHLALIVAAIFSGAALYINVVEQPARLTLDDQALLSEWKPAYKRGFAMQSALAILGCALGFLTWRQTSDVAWLLGALAMIANWPFTLLAIMPTNRQLTATSLDEADSRTRQLIRKWGYLHGVRTALGFLAILLFLLGSTP